MACDGAHLTADNLSEVWCEGHVRRRGETTAGDPVWLDRIDELLQRDGFSPDGEITISIRRSVPELTGAWSSSRAP
jgi:hypothetical protein